MRKIAGGSVAVFGDIGTVGTLLKIFAKFIVFQPA
jgi:hypothetical protein